MSKERSKKGSVPEGAHRDLLSDRGHGRTGGATALTRASSCTRMTSLGQGVTAWPIQDIVSLQSFIVRVHHPCIPAPDLQSLLYCNTIARPLGNIRSLTGPPFVCREPCNIGDGNIV